jgi:hypothetical protein
VAELGPFIESVVKGWLNRAMERNVSIVTWAMAEWYRVSVERANFWGLLEKAVAEKEQMLESISQMRTRRRKRRRKDAEGGDASPDQDDAIIAESSEEKPTKAMLLRYMGRMTFEVPVPSTLEGDAASYVRIQWHIEFDWTGDAKSKVGVLAGVPGKCKTPFFRMHLYDLLTDSLCRAFKR